MYSDFRKAADVFCSAGEDSNIFVDSSMLHKKGTRADKSSFVLQLSFFSGAALAGWTF